MNMELRNKGSILSAAATALLLTMGAGQALAEDGKVYPASFCTPVNHNYVAPFSINAGEWVNEDDSAVVVECPIIKERMDSGLRNGHVRFINQNSLTEFSCTIKSRRTHVFPNQGFSITVGSTTGQSTVQERTFGSLGHNGKNTTYTMKCNVPGKEAGKPSRIMGYYISENT